MQKCFGEGTGVVYQDVLSWLQSSNTQLQLSGALAIANFARNGEQIRKRFCDMKNLYARALWAVSNKKWDFLINLGL